MKRELERQQDNYQVAVEIALQSGAIKECMWHEGSGMYINQFDGDKEEKAYRIANSLFSKEDSRISGFHGRREMTDTIQEVINEAGFRCASCVKWMKD